MKLKRFKFSNLVLLLIITLFTVPQTRKPIQVFLHKGLAMFAPSIVSENQRKSIYDYDWKLQSLDGLKYDFNQAEGKVILINFWATWCPPCIAEMPSFQSLYDDYHDKIEFLLVSQEEKTIIQEFLKKHDYTFKIHRPLSDVPEALNTTSIPRTLIIDKHGNIAIDKTGAANWNSKKVRSLMDRLIVE